MITILKEKDLKVEPEEREALCRALPPLSQIQSREIAEGVIRTWARCLRMSPYDRLEEIPVLNPFPDNGRLVDHINATTLAAIALADAYVKDNGLPINYDHLIASALLLDVDKALCYQYDEEGNRVYTEFGLSMPYGCFGTVAAMEAGLPMEIAHVADCHSNEISHVHSGTPEGVICEYADKAMRRARMVQLGIHVPPKTGYGG